MKRYSLGYFLGQAFKGLWHNGVMTIAAVVILMSCLLLVGSFTSLVYNVNYNLEQVAKLNVISVIVDVDADDAAIESLKGKIGALDNVESFEFVSKEDALESEKARYGENAYLFDALKDDNPLPDVFNITYRENDGVETLVYKLGTFDGVSKVRNRTDIAAKIDNVKNGVSFVFIWFLVILFVVSLFIIINTIKMAIESQSREIEVMRYIGATNFFMSAPFWIEGAVIGAVAGGIGLVAQKFLYEYIAKALASYQIISVVPYGELQRYAIVMFLAGGILMGFIGSVISLRRYLRV